MPIEVRIFIGTCLLNSVPLEIELADQSHFQLQPPDNVGNLSASRPCFWVRTSASSVWIAVSISKFELQATDKIVSCVAHPTKPSKVTQNVSLLIAIEDKLCDIFQGMVQCVSSNLLTLYREQL